MQLQVARIGKPHGIRGEVTVQVLTDAPGDRFVPGHAVRGGTGLGRPVDRGKRTLEQGHPAAGLRGSGDPQRRGSPPRRQAVHRNRGAGEEDDDEGWYEHELVGLDVRVGDTVVGKVSGLHTLPVQDLLVVTDQGGKEILIPFVEQIVPEVNIAEKYVLVTPPDGLFEVNTETGATADDGDSDDGDSDGDNGPGPEGTDAGPATGTAPEDADRRRQHLSRVPGTAGTFPDREGAPGRTAGPERPRPSGPSPRTGTARWTTLLTAAAPAW